MEAPSTFCCICESIKPPLEAVGLVVLVVRECQLLNFKIYKLLRPLASVGLEVDKLFIGDHPELVVSFNCRSVRPPVAGVVEIDAIVDMVFTDENGRDEKDIEEAAGRG